MLPAPKIEMRPKPYHILSIQISRKRTAGKTSCKKIINFFMLETCDVYHPTIVNY